MTAAEHDLVLVVDFGAQYAQLIARRVREARVYSEIVPHTMPVAEMLARSPKAIVLSGGPSSVYEAGAPAIDNGLFTAGTPVFGMCYGFQLMATALGGTVDNTGAREYGRTALNVSRTDSTLFEGTPAEQTVWMSHGDACSAAPEGFTVTASTGLVPVAAFENDEKKLYGVQHHPEVLHSTYGQQVWDELINDNDQIFLTLNGHYWPPGRTTKQNAAGHDGTSVAEGNLRGGDYDPRGVQRVVDQQNAIVPHLEIA